MTYQPFPLHVDGINQVDKHVQVKDDHVRDRLEQLIQVVAIVAAQLEVIVGESVDESDIKEYT